MKFRRINESALLFIVTLLAYGLLIPFTGFYWDDWPFAWIAHFLGPEEFLPAFALFRPFLGSIFRLTTTLLPEHPLVWQIFSVLVHFLAGLSAWFALSRVWPSRKRETLSASLIFLVFPGYSQHWVAFTHINQELIPLTFYLLSFGLTANAQRNPRRFLSYTLAALTFQVCGLFPTEYFFGLEFFRIVFIWIIVSETTQDIHQSLLATIKRWWPYMLVWLGNATWLIYYYNFGSYNSYAITASNELGSTPLASFLSTMADAIYKAGFLAWAQIPGHFIDLLPSAPALIAIILFLLTAGVIIQNEISNPQDTTNNLRSTSIPFLLIGLLGILTGRIPSWAAGLPLTLQSSYDRLMVSMMPGAALFAAGLLSLIRHKGVRVITTSLLIALAVSQQFINANIFRRDWENQRSIYWQFAWRIPALQPGTVIFTQQMPLDYETDLSMTAPLNWIYAPDYQRGEPLPFALLYTEKRLGGRILPNIQETTVIVIPYRTVTFTGTPASSITVYAPQQGCLRVLDPVYANEQVYVWQSSWLTMTIPLSNPARIFVNAPTPQMPASLFGNEPEHEWCYYYEKAELARQRGDWATVIALADEAARLGFAAEDAVEWLPFIEAHTRMGNFDEATGLAQLALNMDPRLLKGVCQIWVRVHSDLGESTDAREGSKASFVEFGCGQ